MRLLKRFRRSKGKGFRKDEKGISDIVGVLIMIAIVVAAAAVIGAFVMSRAPSGTAPVAELHIYAQNGKIFIDHDGGDTINPANIRIDIYKLPSGELVNSTDNPPLYVDTNPTGMFNSGDRIMITSTPTPGAVNVTSLTPGQYTVKVIFIPLDRPIAQNNVYVS